MYSTTCEAAQLVCEHLQWHYGMGAIAAYRRGNTIYAKGTLLKPEEWRELAGYNGTKIGNYTLRVVGVPRGI